MTNNATRCSGIVGVVLLAGLLGCAPAPSPSAMIAGNQTAATPLSPDRVLGSAVIVLPSRELVASEIRGASADHRASALARDIDRTEAETLLLARSAQASRLFDRVGFIRADQPEDAAIGDNDYKIWAQQGSEGFLWQLDDARGGRTEIAFDRLADFPDATFAAVRRLGGTIQHGIGVPMLHVGYNRVFQTPVTSTQEDIVIEIHDSVPRRYRRMILRHVMASKVVRKYQPIIDARAKLYCSGDYSIGFNFIGRKLIYPAIGCRVYCE